jgi:O-antigen/teichoic acid export membrane protein
MLAGTRVATTLLAPEEMGRIALVVALTAFFALFLVNPVGMFINRRLHSWAETGRARAYLGWYWKYLLLVCAGAAVASIALNASGLVALHMESAWLLLLVCGSLFFNTLNQTAIPSLNLLGHRVPFILLTLATIAAGLAAAVGLVVELQPHAEYWLLGLLLGQALFGWIGVRVFYRKLGGQTVHFVPLSGSACRRLWAFAWPVALAIGFNWMHMQGYRFVLERQVGLAELGLFAAGYGLSAALLGGFELILSTYLQPEFYRRANDETAGAHAQAWNDYAGAILPGVVFVTAVVAGAAPEITVLILGPAFQGARDYVMLGALAEVMRSTAGVYGLVAHVRMRTRLLLLPNAGGAVLTVGLVVGLVPIFGVGAAALAVAAGGMLVVLTTHWHVRHEIAIQLPWRRLGHALGMGILLMLVIGGLRSLMPQPFGPAQAFLYLGGIGMLAFPIIWILLRHSIRHG